MADGVRHDREQKGALGRVQESAGGLGSDLDTNSLGGSSPDSGCMGGGPGKGPAPGPSTGLGSGPGGASEPTSPASPTHAGQDPVGRWPSLPGWWLPQMSHALTTGISRRDREVLRLPEIDDFLTAPVLGRPWPRDLLRYPTMRMRALAPSFLPSHVLTGEGALWVHLGGVPPQRIVCSSPVRIGTTRHMVLRRLTIDPVDLTQIGGRTCTTLERSVADVARSENLPRAVAAVVSAWDHGVTRAGILAALERCSSHGATRRPRARRIVTAVYSELGPPQARDAVC